MYLWDNMSKLTKKKKHVEYHPINCYTCGGKLKRGEPDSNKVNGGMDSDQYNKQRHYIHYYKHTNRKYHSCTITVCRIDKNEWQYRERQIDHRLGQEML